LKNNFNLDLIKPVYIALQSQRTSFPMRSFLRYSSENLVPALGILARAQPVNLFGGN